MGEIETRREKKHWNFERKKENGRSWWGWNAKEMIIILVEEEFDLRKGEKGVQIYDVKNSEEQPSNPEEKKTSWNPPGF